MTRSLSIWAVTARVGTTPGAPRYPNSACIALLKREDNSSGRDEGRGPGAKGGAQEGRREGLASFLYLEQSGTVGFIIIQSQVRYVLIRIILELPELEVETRGGPVSLTDTVDL